MLSKLRKGLVYPVSTDITEHDLNTDVETWTYDNREVFRGNVDPDYLSNGVNVYWLYDDFNIRVGLAEHDQSNDNQFAALWFRDTPFGTLFQQDGWTCLDETLWSKMSSAAFEDCTRKNITTPADLIRHYPAMKHRVITPSMVVQPDSWCSVCLSPKCKNDFVFRDDSNVIFIDDDFVLYSFKPSSDDSSALTQNLPELEQAQEQ